ncbi:MAG: hypothetical protein VB862_15730 [Pirellulaceae bacterium]
MRRKLARGEEKPTCPHCGGPTEVQYDACQNCGRNLVWTGNQKMGFLAGKPGQERWLRREYEELAEGVMAHREELVERFPALKEMATSEDLKAKVVAYEEAVRADRFEEAQRIGDEIEAAPGSDDGGCCGCAGLILIGAATWYFWPQICLLWENIKAALE